MELEKRLKLNLNESIQSGKMTSQTRLKCSFPITIKGFNVRGERYDELALTEDVGRRGLCFKTNQTLIPGSMFTIYKMEEDPDPVATFEVVWTKDFNSRSRRVGAQIVGDNKCWLQYLVEDVVVLSGIKIARSGVPTGH